MNVQLLLNGRLYVSIGQQGPSKHHALLDEKHSTTYDRIWLTVPLPPQEKKKKNQSRADSNTRSNCLTARNAEECSKLPGAAIRESKIQPVGNSKNSSGRMTQFLQQTEYREEKRWRGHLQIKRDLKDIFKNKAKLNCNVQGCILGKRVKKWLRSSLGKLLLLGPGGHGTGRVSGWTSGWRGGFQLWTWVVVPGCLPSCNS